MLGRLARAFVGGTIVFTSTLIIGGIITAVAAPICGIILAIKSVPSAGGDAFVIGTGGVLAVGSLCTVAAASYGFYLGAKYCYENPLGTGLGLAFEKLFSNSSEPTRNQQPTHHFVDESFTPNPISEFKSTAPSVRINQQTDSSVAIRINQQTAPNAPVRSPASTSPSAPPTRSWMQMFSSHSQLKQPLLDNNAVASAPARRNSF